MHADRSANQAEREPRYFNRDISWLEFNRRVLAQAEDRSVPLLERVKFLAIVASNLDEFFMKRIGLLKRRASGSLGPGPYASELPATQVLAACRRMVLEMQAVQASVWNDDVRPQLAAHGIQILDYAQLDAGDRDSIDRWYRASVFPILTPLAVDPGHRFPFISNLSENLGVLLDAPPDASGRRERLFARVKIPAVLPQFVRLDTLDALSGATLDGDEADDIRLVPLDDIILHNLDELFPGIAIADVMPFRITRSAAVEVDDEETEDLLEQVEAELRMRRFASALRIQVNPDPSPEILRFVLDELELTDQDVYTRPGPLAYADLFEISELPRPDLRLPRWRPVVPSALADEDLDIFAKIRQSDILLHHPYESFTDSVEKFVDQAAADPDVLAIKQTLYRTSRDSPFVESLVEAAEDGKQVACLVELRARFDEDRNVQFARQLEKAGVHVAYGVVGLKTHCKCSLVVRRERIDGHLGIRTYAHLGTGNYHPGTAQLYTDLGLLTCDPALTADVVKIFNALTGHAAQHDYASLLVAPATMRDRFNELIDSEIKHAKKGKRARIVAKMNSLEDRQITDRLYEASEAGVQIDLIVRGFCSLRPGVRGLSENITVRSIVGRFLEHSRIFYFSGGKSDPVKGLFFFGSADWMYRNLNARVEAVCPVRDPVARSRLWSMIDVFLRDRRKAWTLNPDGSYTRLKPPSNGQADSPEVLGTFEALMRETVEATRR